MKTLFFLLIGLTLVGASCTGQQKNTLTNTNQGNGNVNVAAVDNTNAVNADSNDSASVEDTTNESDSTSTSEQNTNSESEEVVAGGGSEESDTNSSTSNADEYVDWKTYTNDQYGFSFKYPENTAIKFAVENDLIKMQLDTEAVESYNSSIMEIKIIPNTNGISLDTWIAENVNINGVLTIKKTQNSTGVVITELNGANSIEDFGKYAGWNNYFSNKNNTYFFAIAYPQDRTNLEKYGYTFSVLENIKNTIATY